MRSYYDYYDTKVFFSKQVDYTFTPIIYEMIVITFNFGAKGNTDTVRKI